MVKYQPGDVIVECYPFVHCVSPSRIIKACHYCLEVNLKEAPKKCSKCKIARYCGLMCQTKDWKEVHKAECEVFIRQSPRSRDIFLEDDMYRLALRVILLLKECPEKEFEEFETYNGKRSFNSLLSHSKEISEHSDIGPVLQAAWSLFFQPLGVTLGNFFEIYGKIAINSYGISDRLTKIGTGLYIASSVFDHNCIPNACQVFDGLKMQVRALKEIDTEIETPVVNYCGHYLSRKETQKLLIDGFFFKCKCIRCLSPNEQEDEDMAQLLLNLENFYTCTDINEALKSGIKLLGLHLKLFPGPSVELTLTYQRLAMICSLLEDKRGPFFEKKLIENFSITHGFQHSLWQLSTI